MPEPTSPEQLLLAYEISCIAAIASSSLLQQQDKQWLCVKEILDKYRGNTDVDSCLKALGHNDQIACRLLSTELRKSNLYVAHRAGIGGKNRTTVWRTKADFDRYMEQRERLTITSKTTLRDHALQLRGDP